MRFHSSAVAAILFASQAHAFLPSAFYGQKTTTPTRSTTSSGLNMGWSTSSGDMSNSIAGAFSIMNDEMVKNDMAALRELQEISASFRQLAHNVGTRATLPTPSPSTRKNLPQRTLPGARPRAIYSFAGSSSTALSAHTGNDQNNSGNSGGPSFPPPSGGGWGGGGGGGNSNSGRDSFSGPAFPSPSGSGNTNGFPAPSNSNPSNGVPASSNPFSVPAGNPSNGFPTSSSSSNSNPFSNPSSSNSNPLSNPSSYTNSNSNPSRSSNPSFSNVSPYSNPSSSNGSPFSNPSSNGFMANNPNGNNNNMDASSRTVARDGGHGIPNDHRRETDSGSSWQSISREGGPPPNAAQQRGQQGVSRDGPPGNRARPGAPKLTSDTGSSWNTVSRDGIPPAYRKPISDTGASWDKVNIDTASAGTSKNPSNQRAQIRAVTDSGSSWAAVSRETQSAPAQRNNYRRPVSDTGASWKSVNIDTFSQRGPRFSASNQQRRVNDSGSNRNPLSRDGGPPPSSRKPISDTGASWDRVNEDTASLGGSKYSATGQRRETDSGSSWNTVSRDGPHNPRGVKPISDVGASWGTVNSDTVSPGGYKKPTNSRATIKDSGSSWGAVSRETQSAPPVPPPRRDPGFPERERY